VRGGQATRLIFLRAIYWGHFLFELSPSVFALEFHYNFPPLTKSRLRPAFKLLNLLSREIQLFEFFRRCPAANARKTVLPYMASLLLICISF
jgi:hypothetical protein